MGSELWEEVNSRVDLSTLLTTYGVDVSKNGLRGTQCPICNYSSADRPALQIFPAENVCFCHHCKQRIDIYELVKVKEQLENRWEALLFLAKQNGVSIELDPIVKEKLEWSERLSDALKEFAEYFNIHIGPDAIEYLKNRKIEEEFIAVQKIGFIPANATFLSSKKETSDTLKEIGLLFDDGTINPAWCDRIFVPFWRNGRIFYFAGRALNPNNKLPQMLPSNQKMKLSSKPVIGTPFGESVFVDEGLFDFLTALQSQQSVIAILGQSPVFDVPDKIKEINLCFDWDAIGEEYLVKFGLHFLAQKKEVFVYPRPENLPEGKKDLNDFICAGNQIADMKKIPLQDYLIDKIAIDRKRYLPIVFKAISNLGPLDREDAFKKISMVTKNKASVIKEEFDLNFHPESDNSCAVAKIAKEETSYLDVGLIRYKIPAGYEIGPEGIFCRHGNRKELVTTQVVIINGIGYDNLEGRLHVLLQIGKFKETKSIIYRKLQISSNTEILKLSDDGIDVHTASAPKLVKFLAEFYNENEHLFPKLQIVSQLGWSGDIFNQPNSAISKDGTENVYYFENEIRKSGYSKKGSLEGWIDIVRSLKKLKDPSRMFFHLFAGFAGAVLEKMGKKTTIFHNFGETTIGKTTAQMLPASIYGKPTTDGVVQRWYATKNFIPRALEQLRNIPLFLDELSVIRDTDIQDLCYVIEGQRAKGKASANNPLKTVPQRNWCTLIFSTGEPSILSDHSLGGAAVRVIEFSGNPFKEENRQFVEGFRIGLMENYGHAIGPFIEAFLKFDWIRVEWFWDEDELTRIEYRMAEIFQAVYVAGVLFEQEFKIGIDPRAIVKTVFREVRKERMQEGNFLTRFVSYLKDQFSANRASFRDTIRGTIKSSEEYESSDVSSKMKIMGYVFKEGFDAENFDVGFIKSEFNQLVKSWGAGATSRTLLMELEKKKLISCEKNDNRKRKRIDGEVKVLVYFPNFNLLEL